MEKILGLFIAVLIVSATATIVLAPPEDTVSVNASRPVATAVKLTAENRLAYKTMLKAFFSPVIHGNGIGFTDDTYVVARWNIISVRTLSRNQIREVIGEANTTDVAQIRERVQNYLETEGTLMSKGRIKIGDTNYALLNIEVSDGAASADIIELPDYVACSEANTTAEECEQNSTKVGDLSLTKMDAAEGSTDQRVWAGTLNFKDVAYTFVTFAYPRWS